MYPIRYRKELSDLNLLIVDDEYYSVLGVKQKLENSGLKIDNIFSAYSMSEAQEVFSSNKVDILLTDIEMPKGSGFDLLKWARDNGLLTAAIIFTSFATYEYASEALKLQSTDYLLKPVETDKLILAVKRAIDKVDEQEKNGIMAGYWNESRTRSFEIFWQDLATGKTPPSQIMLLHTLNILRLPPETISEKWYPILFDCLPTKESDSWEENLYEYAIKNILSETLYVCSEIPIIPTIGHRQYLVLLKNKPDSPDKIQRAIAACASALPGIFHVFPAGQCTAKTICKVCTELLHLAKCTVYEGSLLYSDRFSLENRTPLPLPDWKSWSNMLLSRHVSDLERDVLQYLSKLRSYKQIHRKDLLSFHHDFLQLIYTFLEKSGSAAHNLFKNSEFEYLSDNACRSVSKMSDWVVYVIAYSKACVSESRNSSGIIETVKTYINDHISEELTRDSLSAIAFVSPDYLSHLFSDKEGISLSSYITECRIKASKELLYKNKLSIRDVAIKCGFQNISYFSKQFKRKTGMTPQEFRKANFK